MNLVRFLPILLLGGLPLSTQALNLAQDPLFVTSTEPRIMLLLSRDHELYKKAYTDYSDLDFDGNLETTYKDSIEYYGYFDSKRCYLYSTSNSRFEPGSAATGPNSHHCNGEWSGNFLNWATMTRIDVLRKVLYGGFRSADDSGTALGTTVLERAFLPPDVHSFAKVFAPDGGSSEVALYTPYSEQAITLCNVSDMADNTQAGSINTVNGVATSPSPLIKVAKGRWSEWAMTEIFQCKWKEQTPEPSRTRPTASEDRLSGANDLVARVAVCAPGALESNCKTYVNSNTGVRTVKPIGLLQQYGDINANRRVRFGLISGSYKNNAWGGVLRKNIKPLSGNTNASDDEVDMNSGRFLNQTVNDAGIINTLNRIHIAGYKTPLPNLISGTQVCSNAYNNSYPFSCNPSSLQSGQNGICVDWGNPLSEMYHEALRYFAGKPAPSTFAVDDGAVPVVIAGMRRATWDSSSDPLPSTEWCALSNIIILSTGLSSLDNTNITSDIPGLNPSALTDAVGIAEGLGTSSKVLIGSNGAESTNTCRPKPLVNGLSRATGICPEAPHMRGGYGIAGLAYSSRSLDLRPSYAAKRAKRWAGINADWVERQPLSTFAVSLAESMPSFEVSLGTGRITLVPSCRSNGSTICSMTDLRVLSYSATKGSFLVSWEDQPAGNDYDMDAISQIDYCVGEACSPRAGPGEIKITVSVVQAATGSTMELGYTVAGSSQDGTYFPIKIGSTGTCNPTVASDAFSLLTEPPTSRPGNAYLSWPACPDKVTRLPSGVVNAGGCPNDQNGGSGSHCGCPKTWTFTPSGSSAALLKNPLWYAAKYGAPADSWDLKNNNTGAMSPDGEPDNFYDVRNPAGLHAALAAVFDAASQPDTSAASVATNSTNLRIQSRVYQARFSSADWSGQLMQYQISTTGVLAANSEWDAGALLQSAADRRIITKGATGGVAFAWDNLTLAQQDALNTNASGETDGRGSDRVTYLRGTDMDDFRPRTVSKLGDIVNSNPWFVAKPDAGYSDVDHPGYSTFRSAYANRTPVVYVGGNDGMLHGFDASLDFSVNPSGVPSPSAGKEILAYIPSTVYGNLSRLTALDYNKNHRYFVDGSPMIADVDIDSPAGNRWRTVLIGSLGAGGKGYFALDVTDPSSFGESGAGPADTLLWESDETDMGFAFNQPPAVMKTNQAKQIVKLASGKWAAVLGNGYNSANGKAVLYVVYIKAGVENGIWKSGDFVKIIADAPTGKDNGLSTPVPFDSNGDGHADTVYAGDLKGNLWKFLIGPNASDPSVTNDPSTWKVAFSENSWDPNTYTVTCSPCKPLFVAKNASNEIQPITWPPEVTLHPVMGHMVLFGTGKYLESGDNSTTQVQSFYGIWDWHDGTDHSIARGDLVQQTVTSSNIGGKAYRTPSANAINWREPSCKPPYKDECNISTHMGWYMDLPTSGERLTGIAKLDAGTIFFNTLIPSTLPCDAGGTGWLMALNYLNGGLLGFPVFDTNSDGLVNSSDTLVGGLQIGAALGGTTLIRGTEAGPIGVGVSSLTTGHMTTTMINFGPPEMRGRVSWREIVQ